MGPGGDVEPVCVDRHRHDRRLGGAQYIDRRAVARVLDPGGGAGIEQHLRREAQPLLGAGGQHDLLRPAAHPARGGEIIGDRPAQRRFALRVAIIPHQARAARQNARREALPGGDEAGVDLGMPRLERASGTARRRAVRAQPFAAARQRTRSREVASG